MSYLRRPQDAGGFGRGLRVGYERGSIAAMRWLVGLAVVAALGAAMGCCTVRTTRPQDALVPIDALVPDAAVDAGVHGDARDAGVVHD